MRPRSRPGHGSWFGDHQIRRITNHSRFCINGGSFVWNAGDINLWNSTPFTNTVTGTFTITGNNSFQQISGTPTFTNAGTVTKTGGAGTTLISVPTTNSGTISGSVGAIYISNGLTNTGTLSCPVLQVNGTSLLDAGTVMSVTDFQLLGGTLNVNPALAFSSLTIVAGTCNLNLSCTFNSLQILGGTCNLSLPCTATDFNFTSGGTLNGPGSLTVSNTMDWQEANMNTDLILTSTCTFTKTAGGSQIIGGSVTNNGIVNWSGGHINLHNSTVFTNTITGTINATGNDLFQQTSGSTLFANAGTFSKTGGAGTTTISTPCTNTGTVTGTTGIIFLSGGLTNTGTLGGPTMQVSGTTALNVGTVMNVTDFQQIGGTLATNVPIAFSTFQMLGGTLNLNSPCTTTNLTFGMCISTVLHH